MAYWIVPSNDSTFRIGDAIKANGGVVDWRQSNNFAVGDVVFIYKAKPEQRVVFRMEVTGVEINEEDALEQEKFWTDQMAFFDGLGRSQYVRFKLLEEYHDDIFSLHHLHEHGFRGNMQSVQHCPEESIPYMLDPYGEVNSDAYDIDYPEDDEKLYEGALVPVLANKYERNRAARKKCIELKGYRCVVCGKDFEKTYGEDGKDFIHVHHLVPISKIGKEYQLDIEKDLVPVCPNCHYMLHRKDPPFKPEELRRKLVEAEIIEEINPTYPSKLSHIEEDQDVRKLVFDMLLMNKDFNDMEIQRDVLELYGDRYPEMKLKDWNHIINDYIPMVKEAISSKTEKIAEYMSKAAEPISEDENTDKNVNKHE